MVQDKVSLSVIVQTDNAAIKPAEYFSLRSVMLQNTPQCKRINQIFGLRNIAHMEAQEISCLLQAVFYSVLMDLSLIHI